MRKRNAIKPNVRYRNVQKQQQHKQQRRTLCTDTHTHLHAKQLIKGGTFGIGDQIGCLTICKLSGKYYRATTPLKPTNVVYLPNRTKIFFKIFSILLTLLLFINHGFAVSRESKYYL